MNQLKKLISSVSWQLFTSDFLKCLLVMLSLGFLVFGFTHSLSWALVLGGLGFGVMAYQTQLFRNRQPQAIEVIHQKLNNTEYSLHLLDKPQLNIAEQLQIERLLSQTQSLPIPSLWYKNLHFYGLALILSLCTNALLPFLKIARSDKSQLTNNPDKTVEKQNVIPQFHSATLTVTPPTYTNLPQKSGSELNISSIVGSVLKWQLRFENANQLKVKLSNSRGDELDFKQQDESFELTDQLVGSGLYAFKAYWRDSLIYQSDFYRLEAIADLAPKIEPTSKELYEFHLLKDPKNIQISAKISDDFLINQAFIVATVARGSGENVKFREIKLPLSQLNFKEAMLSKSLDLKALNFAPGDELYYYWAAIDNKRPEPNFTKSDTYFIVYKDTANVEESELATMAMNILPEYFRSQRQIIIDTEKLIAKRKKISEKEFKFTSNEIGFDQKALRLRYGQYLGEEFENSIGGPAALPTADDTPKMGGDLLKGFRHDHDEGEHDHEDGDHAHGHDHGNESKGNDDNKDPYAAILADYVHSHDDGEMNTFYEQSTRSLLKMALEQMWQSELYLRLYEPEKAIPFEKKALEFLKQAQQKARTYVKKTSFDPPPIKEKEKRMTGELTRFNAEFSYEKNFSQQRVEQLVGEVMGIIEAQKQDQKLSGKQKQKVFELGQILSTKAINSSMSNWSILGDLQLVMNDKVLEISKKDDLKTKLYALIGKGLTNKNNPQNPSYQTNKKLEQAYWKHSQ